jgi:hypothetical protein
MDSHHVQMRMPTPGSSCGLTYLADARPAELNSIARCCVQAISFSAIIRASRSLWESSKYEKDRTSFNLLVTRGECADAALVVAINGLYSAGYPVSPSTGILVDLQATWTALPLWIVIADA